MQATTQDLAQASAQANEQAEAQIWDVVVIGGGITGAGILREAARQGLRAILLEQGDFASGTSSRSSKLVHGGLRYLSHGDWRLTVESVRERETLLREAPGLVDSLDFSFPIYQGQKPGLGIARFGLALYDLIAGRWRSRRIPQWEWPAKVPRLDTRNVLGVLHFEDAQTDDARLVLRLLQESCAHGAHAHNYTRVTRLLQQGERITGVAWEAADNSAQSGEIRATTVINATGAWAELWGGTKAPRLRPLRGSHLIFPAKKLALPSAVSFLHPQDKRPVFAYAWEGVALLGTTDLDHATGLQTEPRISAEEVNYLLAAAQHAWPQAGLSRADVVTSYAGVRSVVDGGAARPSDESRESAMWQQDGLISITGGKLTTFRVTARKVLAAIGHVPARRAAATPVFDAVPILACPAECSTQLWRRLCGRYGTALPVLIEAAQSGDFATVGGSLTVWAELRHAAGHESVRHLDDLLLRRTRLGLVLADACRAEMPRIRQTCQVALGWDDRRWSNEEGAWYRRWHDHYSLPAESAT